MQEIRKIRPNHGSCVNCVNPEHMEHIDVLRNHHSPRQNEFRCIKALTRRGKTQESPVGRICFVDRLCGGKSFVRRGGLTGA
jgi:hypothetical protein